MKGHKSFWVVILFVLLSALPFVPVALSLAQIRSSVLLDKSVTWETGKSEIFQVPPLSPGEYEIRLDSDRPDWQPVVQVSWDLIDSLGQKTHSSGEKTEEVMLTRAIGKFKIKSNSSQGYKLQVQFQNSNPEGHPIRLKLGLDRGLLLDKSARLFGITLAISLALIFLLWKPLVSIR